MKQYVCLSAERINAGKLNLVTILNRKTMKKNILKVAFVAAIAMLTGIQVFNAQKSEALSEVAMANVEVLAADDDSASGCTFSLLSICETVNGDHHFYRNLKPGE